MRTVIINRFSPRTIDYESILKDIDSEFILVTKDKHVDSFNTGLFSVVIGCEDMGSDERVYWKIAQLHREKRIDRVVAAHEFDLVKAGQLRDYLGLKGQSEASALAFRDKVLMKEYAAASLDVPRFTRVRHVFDLIDFKEKHGFPFVVKPVDSAGSVGVRIIREHNDFEGLLQGGLSAGLEAECYVEGDMYHVDGLYEPNQLRLCSVSKYMNGCLAFRHNDFLGSAMLDYDDPLFGKLESAATKALMALPVPEHRIAFHAEFFHTEDGSIILCEIASRVGGGEVNDGVRHSTGVDIMKESIREQCGVTTEIAPYQGELTGWILIPPRQGKLVSVHAEAPYDWVLKYVVKEGSVGKTFEGPKSSVDAVASLLIAGQSHEQLKERLPAIYKWFMEQAVWENNLEAVTV